MPEYLFATNDGPNWSSAAELDRLARATRDLAAAHATLLALDMTEQAELVLAAMESVIARHRAALGYTG